MSTNGPIETSWNLLSQLHTRTGISLHKGVETLRLTSAEERYPSSRFKFGYVSILGELAVFAASWESGKIPARGKDFCLPARATAPFFFQMLCKPRPLCKSERMIQRRPVFALKIQQTQGRAPDVMPPSMRHQTRALAVVASAHKKCVTAKKHAVKFLKQGKSRRTIAQLTGLSKGSVFSLKKLINEERWDELAQHFHLEKSGKVGAPRVLTTDEERMIVERLKYSAKKGFEVVCKHPCQVMGDVANDGRDRAYKNFYPNGYSVRSFRARHRDLTFRNSENKEAVKLKGERFEHVDSFFHSGDCREYAPWHSP